MSRIVIDISRLKSLKHETSVEELSKKWNVDYSTAMRYIRKLGRFGFVEGKVVFKQGRGRNYHVYKLTEKGEKLLNLFGDGA